MKLVVVGSVALDSVETPSGLRENILGGSATYFSTSASFFTDVNLVAVVGEDFPREHLEFLKSRRINLDGLSVAQGGKTFRWSGKYLAENLNEAITLDTQLNVFAQFKPAVPASYQNAEVLFLANIDPDLQLQVLEQVSKAKFIACDTMNLWINTKRASLEKLIKRVHMFVINETEARLLSGEHHIVRAARAIQKIGVRNLCIKRGEYGALLFHDEQIFHAPAYPLEQVSDPTGAGDTFAGGMIGHLARADSFKEKDLRRAMINGAVMASFTVEAFSLDRLKNLTQKEIELRFNAFKFMTHFE